MTPPYYPAFLNLTGKRCVVVGGGKVAERKILSLLESGGA
ncbi:MAG: NAD(P)-dependent oxidoreductase, partial [Nitrospirales bacterium]|nr:NAD(P)-dependent oxidoreductase [Nitrospirales bacterium]